MRRITGDRIMADTLRSGSAVFFVVLVDKRTYVCYSVKDRVLKINFRVASKPSISCAIS